MRGTSDGEMGCVHPPRILKPQLLLLPLAPMDFMREKWDCTLLKETLQVASEVTYMEHMCLFYLVVEFPPLATEHQVWE